jgi:hypothetical protein
LADLFSLLSAVRLASTQQFIANENSSVLAKEYEQLVEKIADGTRLSPFLNDGDFMLPSLPQSDGLMALMPQEVASETPIVVKDNKGQIKGQKDKLAVSQGQNKRTGLILEFVRKHKNVSIKDISKVIRDVSEKTIQRELALLIQQGLIEKRGERRWSVYSPI